MTLRMFLGFLLALTPLPGMCLTPAPLSHASFTERPKLGLSDEYLQLAAAENLETDMPVQMETNAYDSEFPNLLIPTEPDKSGLIRDTKLFLLYQVAVVGVLYMMPESVSQWSEDDKNGNVFGKWDENVNNLRKDKDDWGINFIGHPYFGAVYYVRARHRGYDRQDSFLYATIMSTIYEYGIEALFEPVSIQDLIFTPIGGAVMGEYFMIAREKIKRNIAAKGYADTSDKVNLFFTDPLGTINAKVNKMFGHKENDQARLELYPMVRINSTDHSSMELQGIQAFYRW